MEADLVSVIIPCYNYGWLLPETLDSLLAQTYSTWEAIIIDDGSTDDTRLIVERYQKTDQRFKYIYQVNKGLSAARNRGLDEAQGAYIQFLDSDDLLVPKKFETQVGVLASYPSVDLVYGSMRYFQHGKPAILSRSADMQDSTWMAEVDGEGQELINVLVEKSIMVVTAPLLRTSLASRVGKFSEDMRSVEDWDFWIRCAVSGGRFKYDATPDAWVLIRVHPTSMSQNMLKMNQYELRMRKKLSKVLVEKKLHQAVQLNKTGISQLEDHLAMHAMREGDLLVGIKGYIKLAYTTGRYAYYFKSIPYWLKKRLLTKL